MIPCINVHRVEVELQMLMQYHDPLSNDGKIIADYITNAQQGAYFFSFFEWIQVIVSFLLLF